MGRERLRVGESRRCEKWSCIELLHLLPHPSEPAGKLLEGLPCLPRPQRPKLFPCLSVPTGSRNRQASKDRKWTRKVHGTPHPRVMGRKRLQRPLEVPILSNTAYPLDQPSRGQERDTSGFGQALLGILPRGRKAIERSVGHR